MILTQQLIRERIDWIREQGLWIQRQPEDMRSQNELDWLAWAGRRVAFLTKEGAGHE